MRKSFYLLVLFCVTLLASCEDEVCRSCPAVEYDTAAFAPQLGQDIISFRLNDTMTINFVLGLTVESPENEACTKLLDDASQIVCEAFRTFQYSNTQIGVDMSISFVEQSLDNPAVENQVVHSYAFKGSTFTDFLSTHSVRIEPRLLLEENRIERRDSVTINGVGYTDVFELIQPEEAFDFTELPIRAQFKSIFVKDGVGLLRLVDVSNNVYDREF